MLKLILSRGRREPIRGTGGESTANVPDRVLVQAACTEPIPRNPEIHKAELLDPVKPASITRRTDKFW